MRPLEIAFRVLMGALHPCAFRQCSKALQRSVHVRRRALKQPAASSAEKGVAAEERRGLFGGRTAVREEKGEMGTGMSAHINDVDRNTQQVES